MGFVNFVFVISLLECFFSDLKMVLECKNLHILKNTEIFPNFKMNSDRKKITQFVAHFSLALQVIQ